MEELRKTVALVFRQAGKDALDEKDFKLTVSMKLKWFSPGEAKELLGTARKAGLLKKKGKAFLPTFDIGGVEIPVDFKPDKKVLELQETPLFSKVVDTVASETEQERTTIVAKINKKQEKLGIDVRVVALMVARESGVDVGPFLEETEEHVVDTYGMSRTSAEEEE